MPVQTSHPCHILDPPNNDCRHPFDYGMCRCTILYLLSPSFGPATHAHPRPNGSWNGPLLCGLSLGCHLWPPMHGTHHMTSIHHGPSPSGSVTYDSIPYCPYPLISPTTKPAMGVFLVSIVWRHITPRGPSLNIQHTAKKHPICLSPCRPPRPSRPDSRSFNISPIRSERSGR